MHKLFNEMTEQVYLHAVHKKPVPKYDTVLVIKIRDIYFLTCNDMIMSLLKCTQHVDICHALTIRISCNKLYYPILFFNKKKFLHLSD